MTKAGLALGLGKIFVHTILRMVIQLQTNSSREVTHFLSSHEFMNMP